MDIFEEENDSDESQQRDVRVSFLSFETSSLKCAQIKRSSGTESLKGHLTLQLEVSRVAILNDSGMLGRPGMFSTSSVMTAASQK